MNLVDLKAHAYDCLSIIEHWQKKLQETNAKIAEETSRLVAQNQAEEVAKVNAKMAKEGITSEAQKKVKSVAPKTPMPAGQTDPVDEE